MIQVPRTRTFAEQNDSANFGVPGTELNMVDLIALKLELAHARRARIEAELAGANLERMIERMRVGRTLQQIELEEQAAAEPSPCEPLQHFLAAA
jgi:hypothetical protein